MPTYQRTKKDAKKASREAKKGDVLYVIAEVSKRHAPYEDKELCKEYRVKYMHPLIPQCPMISGALSVEGLVLREGPVYTSRPAALRAVHETAPQLAGPPAGGVLDKAELRGLGKENRDAAREHKRAGRKRWL